jgi:hypothetical protein
LNKQVMPDHGRSPGWRTWLQVVRAAGTRRRRFRR